MSKVVNFGCRLNNFEGKKIEELLVNNSENQIFLVKINSKAILNTSANKKGATPNSKIGLSHPIMFPSHKIPKI